MVIRFSKSIPRCIGENWNIVLDKLTSRIQTLSSRNISIFGRATIANTILLSKAWYVARIFLPPPTVLKDIKKALNEYIWDGKHQSISTVNFFKPISQGDIDLLPPLEQAYALQIADLNLIGDQNPSPRIFYARYWTSAKVFRFHPDWNFLNTNLIPRNIQGRIPTHLDVLLRRLKDSVGLKSKTTASIRRS